MIPVLVVINQNIIRFLFLTKMVFKVFCTLFLFAKLTI